MRNNNYDPAAILAALADGQRQVDVAAQFGVSRSLVSRLAINNGHRRRAQRPLRPCENCGAGTHATRGVCRTCREWSTYPEPTAAEELTGGAWVLDPVRRIQVWRAA